MIVKLLKTTRPMALLFFFGIALLLWLFQLFHLPAYFYADSGYPLFDLLQVVLCQNQWLAATLVLLITLLLGMGLNNLITEKGVLKYNTLLPATTFVLMVAPFSFSPVWPAVFILLFVLNKLLSMYQKDRPYSEVYDAGFLIGLATLFYAPSLFLFPIIYVANLTYSVFGWRNYIIPIVGFLSPLLLVLTHAYWVVELGILLEHYWVSLGLQGISLSVDTAWLIWLIALLVLLICSLKEVAQWIALKSLRSRKSFIIILSYLICGIPALFCVAADGWNHLLLLSIPLAALGGNYFLFARKWWWYETLFVTFLLSAIYFHISAVLGL